MVDVQACTITELEQCPAFTTLLDEYAAECRIAGFPPPAAQLDMYHMMESAGAVQSFGAFRDGNLIGFIVVLTHSMPHYGAATSTLESYFVSRKQRKGGAGVKLLQAAKRHARDKGAAGLLISAPYGGRLNDVMLASKHRQTNAVFFVRLNDE